MFKLQNFAICKCSVKGNIKDNGALLLLWLHLPATMSHIRAGGLGGEEKIHLKFSSLKKKTQTFIISLRAQWICEIVWD